MAHSGCTVPCWVSLALSVACRRENWFMFDRKHFSRHHILPRKTKNGPASLMPIQSQVHRKKWAVTTRRRHGTVWTWHWRQNMTSIGNFSKTRTKLCCRKKRYENRQSKLNFSFDLMRQYQSAFSNIFKPDFCIFVKLCSNNNKIFQFLTGGRTLAVYGLMAVKL